MGLFDSLFGRKPAPPPKPAAQPSKLAELASKFPFPVRAVHGAEAEKELLRLREELRPTGTFPVLVGDYQSAVNLVAAWNHPYDYEKELELSRIKTPEAWLAERVKEDEGLCLAEDQDVIHEKGTGPMTRLQIPFDLRNRPVDEVFIALIPTDDPATIPLRFQYGDWNACPSPHVHAMLARCWREQYGAELATLASDVIEFTVSRLPATDEAAKALALQQYLYCGDIVDQGVGTVATLAKALRHSTRWYFWWD